MPVKRGNPLISLRMIAFRSFRLSEPPNLGSKSKSDVNVEAVVSEKEDE